MASLVVDNGIEVEFTADMLDIDGDCFHISEEAVHSHTGIEVASLDEVNCIMTALLSGMISMGCLDSLRMLYTASIAVASPGASILWGLHLV